MCLLISHNESVKFVKDLNVSLKKIDGKGLSKIKSMYLAFCLTAMICCKSLNLELFERSSLGYFKAKSIGYFLKRIELYLDLLWYISINRIIDIYNIKEGYLLADDTDRVRSKNVTKIYAAQKTKDKKTGGYCTAQNIVLLSLVTTKVSIPVGFSFFQSDPRILEWKKTIESMKLKGIKRNKFPKKPLPNKDYPTRLELLEKLIFKFKKNFDNISIKGILFDSAYLSKNIVKNLSHIYPNKQIISQIRLNQMVSDNLQIFKTVENYFLKKEKKELSFKLRGTNKTVEIEYTSARLHVKAHGRKLHVIAVRYKNAKEKGYRYIVATNLTWRAEDIIRAYTLRWIIEVTFEDWKLHEGYGIGSMQRGYESAHAGVTLSFLVDHLILSHPLQIQRSKAGKRLLSVGSIGLKIRLECLLETIYHLFSHEISSDSFNKVKNMIINNFVFERESYKHLCGNDCSFNVGPTKSLSAKFRNSS